MKELRPQHRALIIAIVIAAALVTAVHWPVLSAGALSLDDSQFLTENFLVQNPSWASMRQFFVEVLEPSTVGGYYLPLTMSSLMVDVAFGGRPDHLRPFHQTSLVFHVLNTALVIWLLFLFFRDPWAAAAVGLLFGAHPLTVEPVIWIGERKTLLATFFALGCILAYVQHTRGKGRVYLFTAVLAYAMSLLSKPTATTLPVLLLFLDIWPLKRFGRRAAIEKIPFLVVGAGSVVITLISHARTAGLGLSPNPTLDQMVLLVCRNVFFYFQKILLPVNLTSFYHVPEPLRLNQPAVLMGMVGMVILGVVLIASWRNTRAPMMGLAFFVLALSPTLGLVRYSWVLLSDKYVYFPSFGLLLLLGWFFTRLRRTVGTGRPISVLLLVGVLILVGLEARGVRAYQAKWSDSATLFRHMVDLAPEAPLAHCMYGRILMRDGREDDAMEQFFAAVEIDSTDATGHTEIGVVLFGRGDLEGAMKRWRTALASDSEFADAHVNFGIGLSRQGKTEEAMKSFREALRLRPKNPYALNNLGLQLFGLGRVAEASALFADAVQVKTNYADARLNLGIALTQLGRPAEAIEQLQAADRYGADSRLVDTRMADAYLKAGRPEYAATLYGRLVEQTPGDARIRNNYAHALTRVGRLEDALAQARKAVDLDSLYVDPRMNMAIILEQRGDIEAAVREYRTVLRMQPENSAARQALARALEKLGR